MAEHETEETTTEETPETPETPETDEDTATEVPETDDEPFDKERAKAKISKVNKEAENLRKRLKELEPLAQKAKELEDANKTDLQRLQEASESNKTRADAAEQSYRRLQTALDRAPEGATLAQIRAVAKRASGDSEDELAADVDELFELLTPKQPPNPSRKPHERLRGGGDPTEEPDETDPAKLAGRIRRSHI